MEKVKVLGSFGWSGKALLICSIPYTKLRWLNWLTISMVTMVTMQNHFHQRNGKTLCAILRYMHKTGTPDVCSLDQFWSDLEDYDAMTPIVDGLTLNVTRCSGGQCPSKTAWSFFLADVDVAVFKFTSTLPMSYKSARQMPWRRQKTGNCLLGWLIFMLAETELSQYIHLLQTSRRIMSQRFPWQ